MAMSGKINTDKKIRSIFKAISWRLLATMTTFLISFFITHNLRFALSIGSVEVLSKLILYYIHERLWQQFNVWRYHDNAFESNYEN